MTELVQMVLTLEEQQELERCEAVIEQGLQTFVDVGNALLTIRDGRLYRNDYRTFEAYVWERWKLEIARAYQLMNSSKLIANLSTMVDVLPQNERQARPLTRLEPEQQREAWMQVVEEHPDGEITGAVVQDVVDRFRQFATDNIALGLDEFGDPLPEESKRSNGMSVHFSSETPEHYTPQVIIAATRACMGRIDLDPCSNNHGSPNVPASMHFTKEDDGLAQEWHGKVYMNPPYGREIGDWVEKLCTEHEKGRVIEAIALVPSRTDTQWWRRLRDYPVCFIEGRLSFGDSDNSAPFPSAVFYLGEELGNFYRAFYALGDCWQRMMPGISFGE